MNRKWTGFILCCVLLFVYSVGCAVEYTLPTKLSRQLEIGSGLKGSFVIETEGTGEIPESLALLNGAEFQIRGISSGGDLYYYVYQTDAAQKQGTGEEEKQWAKTELYLRGDTVYLRSDLFGNGVFSVPAPARLADMLTQKENGNIPITSALLGFLSVSKEDYEQKWQPALSPYEKMIEMWLPAFSVDPQMRKNEDDTTIMDLGYSIPMSALKEEILVLLDAAMLDEDLIGLLSTVMSEEQMNTYLQPDLLYFYAQAMDQLNLDFDATLSRTMTTFGDILSTSVELPLDPSATGLISVRIENKDGMNTLTLEGQSDVWHILWPETLDLQRDNESGSVWLVREPGSENGDASDPLALRIDYSQSGSASVDEETRTHETMHYSVQVVRDVTRIPESMSGDDCMPFEPLTLDLDLHYSSKYAQSSPTTVEINCSAQQEDWKVSLTGSLKSASPWVFSPFDVTGARDLLSLTEEEQNNLLMQGLLQAASVIEKNANQPAPAEETEAAETQEAPETEETPEATEAPEAAESPEPSPEVPEMTEEPEATPAPDAAEDTQAAEAGETENEAEAEASDAGTEETEDKDADVSEPDPDVTPDPEADG